jgi:hypothetical protein
MPTSWTNTTKNASSFTNQTKNSATFTNLAKTLRDFLLQETGFRLLQENGFAILLDPSPTTSSWNNLAKN